jgi:hypothetical protein
MNTNTHEHDLLEAFEQLDNDATYVWYECVDSEWSHASKDHEHHRRAIRQRAWIVLKVHDEHERCLHDGFCARVAIARTTHNVNEDRHHAAHVAYECLGCEEEPVGEYFQYKLDSHRRNEDVFVDLHKRTRSVVDACGKQCTWSA